MFCCAALTSVSEYDIYLLFWTLLAGTTEKSQKYDLFDNAIINYHGDDRYDGGIVKMSFLTDKLNTVFLTS